MVAPHDPLSATAQHIDLLQRKMARLDDALADAERQYLAALEREREARNVSYGELLEAWTRLRGTGPCRDGLVSDWNDAVGVPIRRLVHLAQRERQFSTGPWLGSFPFSPDAEMPVRGQSVVYVLVDDNQPIYVGSTEQFRYRMTAHQKAGKRWNTWAAHLCPDREAAYAMEDRFLRQYMPAGNRMGARRAQD